MSTSLFARNERHRLILMALRIRVIVYAAVGIPIMLSAELTLVGDVVAIAGLAAAAAVPLLIRSSTSLSGIGVAATTDVAIEPAPALACPFFAHEVFADCFETGDTSAWSVVVGEEDP